MIKFKRFNFVYFFIYFVVISSALVIYSCSDLNEDNITPPVEISVHGPGILNKQSPNWHGNLVRNNKWDLHMCQQCHGANYSGGTTGASCLTCHTNTGGPEACNTCHGQFNNSQRIAPPRDINRDTATTFLGVGAHTKHLYENSLGNSVRCSTCHKFPQDYNSPGHVDSDLPAEVNLTRQATAHGADNAIYDHSDGSCANTYCHGNFTFYKDSTSLRNQSMYTSDKMTGISNTVIWNKVDGSQIKCGSCHGLPPTGHKQVELKDCTGCHREVVDANGNIIDKTKHINGVINVYGE
jgi:hypothetical protein